MAHRDQLVPLERMALTALRVRPAQPEQQVAMAPTELKVRLDQPVQPEQQVAMARTVPRAPQGRRVLQVFRGQLARPEATARRGPQGRPDQPERRARVARRARQDQPEHQERPVLLALRDQLDQRGALAGRVPQGLQVSQAAQDQPARLDRRGLAQPAPRDRQDPLGARDQLVEQVRPDRLAQTV